jgi:hypothetical protein
MILSRSAAGVTRLLKWYGEQVKGEESFFIPLWHSDFRPYLSFEL